MTTEITEPTVQASAPETARFAKFTEHVPAVEALADLVQMFGRLPKPFIMMTRSTACLELQMDSPSEFEQWRVALQIAPAEVKANSSDTDAWLAADGVFRGVAVRLTGFGLLLPREQDDAPAVSA